METSEAQGLRELEQHRNWFRLRIKKRAIT